MTMEDALKLMDQVCSSVSANLDTHNKIQEALALIKEAVKPKTGGC